MVSAVLVIVIIVMSVLMLGLSIYTLIIYIHPDDKGWGTALYCKILVVVGIFLTWAQALLLPLDVANNVGSHNSGGLDMVGLWFAVYVSILIMVTLLLPFAIFFYQTDDQKSFCSRFLTAVLFQIIALAVVCIVLFVTWNFWQYVDLPVSLVQGDINSSSSSSSTAAITTTSTTTTSTTLTIASSLAVYIMAIMSFFGWIFLILFGGVGMFALPLDLIKEFTQRPTARTSSQMQKTRQAIVKQSTELAAIGAELKQQQDKINKNEEDGWFTRFQKKRTFETTLNKFKARFDAIQQQYQIFEVELAYNDSNPFVPIGKLILGIVLLITATLWMIQLIFGYLARNPTINTQPLIPFLNELLNYMENNNAGFISTFIYSYFILYLVWAVQKGNIKFGIRIPFLFKFHPMKENQTWMNSFLFNVILVLISAVGVTQLAASCFPGYSRNTEIYNMFGIQINYMRFYTSIYKLQIFPIALVIWAFLSLFYLIYAFFQPPKYLKQIEEIRNKRRQE